MTRKDGTIFIVVGSVCLTAGPRPGTGPGINYTGPREVLL